MWRRAAMKGLGMGVVVLQYGCIAHCSLEFLADFVVCSGPSMLSTINPNDIVLTEHISVNSKKIERGDIVIARSPINPTQHVCKRVTGLEGDWIENPPTCAPHSYIPRGHVWLEGDNRANSTDSNVYGPVPYGLLRSRVFFKIWPLYDMGKLSRKG